MNRPSSLRNALLLVLVTLLSLVVGAAAALVFWRRPA